MDLVLVGLPGSGKSAVGRRVAKRHGATFIDLDTAIEDEAGRTVPEIFADEGETGFRARERAAIAALGPADPDREVRRVIAPGGGAVVDPRNRWALYRDRTVVWLDGRPEVLAQRLRGSPNVRPLVVGRDPISTLRTLAASRARFYQAADRIHGVTALATVVDRVEEIAARPRGSAGTRLLDAETGIGRVVIGDGIATAAVAEALRRLEARRAIVISEPGAWVAAGERLHAAIGAAGFDVVRVILPQGEAAKTLEVVGETARQLARLNVERREPIVAIGGGALGDTAGFIAATFLRGLPLIHVPTTLVAQIDSAIGGKTAVNLPEGKNLVGAFHQPQAIVIDVSLLATLGERDRRAALGEAVKMAALGDERLFELLERDGDALAAGDPGAARSGAVAELVERAAWAKVEVVTADERESGVRISLNLGHSLGHAFEAAGGYGDLLHGEGVAFGLRAAARIGVAMDVTPTDCADRIERLLDTLRLGVGPLPYSLAVVLEHLARDKKHAGGRLRWVLPTAGRAEVRSDVPDELVSRVAQEILSGQRRSATREEALA
jgi:shikimate kinase/3-dehydroquinate synthase